MIQKIDAIAGRSIVQPRDIFDLYFLLSQYNPDGIEDIALSRNTLSRAWNNVMEVDFTQFRDVVLSYLLQEDQALYGSPHVWDEIRLKVVHFLEGLAQ